MNPNLVKYIIFPLHEMVIGRRTYAYLSELEKQQWLTLKEIEELRFRKLQELLIHSQKNIPFYAERFAKAGFNARKMQCIEDIKVIPPLTKAEIRCNLKMMQWKACPGGVFKYNTGGSSGEPLIFYFDRRRQAFDAAARALTHKWWGVDIGDKELYLWGSPVEINKQNRMKKLRDWLINAMLINAYEISPQKVPAIVQEFKKFKPKCIFGYPSTIAIFCQMAEQLCLSLNDLEIKVVFTTAEVLYEHQREIISRFIGHVPVADCYGSREGGFVSHQCREGTYHIIDPNYVIEFLKDGKPVEAGEDGEIVITHLDAWGMPFIRYRTSDVAQPGINSCKCGRQWSTMSHIRGRATDFIVTPDGRWQHSSSLTTIIREIEGIVEFKIIQNDPDDIQVLLKINKNIYPKNGNEKIVSGFKKRMGEEIKVKIEMVDTIPRDPSGKYCYVVSRVAKAGLRG